MSKRLWLPLAMLVALSMVLVAFPAFAADPNMNVNTSAQVTGVGMPPVVEKKWELAYGTMGQVNQTFTPDPLPLATNGYWVWSLVSSPFGIESIAAVYADIYKPGATPSSSPYYKQFHCVAVPYEGTGVSEVQAAIEAGIAANFPIGDKAYAFDQLFKRQWVAYKCEVPYSICNPVDEPGLWGVNVWASDTIGTVSAGLWNQITIMAVKMLAVDFSAVDYGQIRPGLGKWVRGDTLFQDPNSVFPTVQIRGNVPWSLEVMSSKMIGVVLKKEILEFDVKLGTHEDIDYSAELWTGPLGMIDPCINTQIDFSIHPPSTIPADTYTGTMSLRLAGN